MNRSGGGVWRSPALAVVRQFIDPPGAYRSLSGAAAPALLPVLALAVVWAFLPRLLLDWEGLEREWELERRAELLAEGDGEAGAARADSIVALELDTLRWQRENIPYLSLLTRVLYTLLGAGATYWLAKAAGWRSSGTPAEHAQAAALAQGGYVVVSGVLTVGVVVTGFSGLLSLDLGRLLPAVEGGVLLPFFRRFLGYVDLPSVSTIVVWGIGLGSTCGETRLSGIRLVGAIYLLAAMLVSAPLLVSARA